MLGTTINKYCYLSVRRLPPFFEHKHRVVYSKIELADEISEIEHPSVRAVMQVMGVGDVEALCREIFSKTLIENRPSIERCEIVEILVSIDDPMYGIGQRLVFDHHPLGLIGIACCSAVYLFVHAAIQQCPCEPIDIPFTLANITTVFSAKHLRSSAPNKRPIAASRCSNISSAMRAAISAP